jgi:hypothetical protein
MADLALRAPTVLLFRPFAAAFLLLIAAAAVTGCATYRYPAQQYSAYVRGQHNSLWFGTLLPLLGETNILKIDGQTLGPFLTGNANSGTHVSPRKHEILVLSKSAKTNYDNITTFVVAEFVAGHMYRFVISGSDQITLWDETAGLARRTSVDHWAFDGWGG